MRRNRCLKQGLFDLDKDILRSVEARLNVDY